MTEHVRFAEHLVGGDGDAVLFLALGEDLEEQFGSMAVKIPITELVDLCVYRHRSIYTETGTMPGTRTLSGAAFGVRAVMLRIAAVSSSAALAEHCTERSFCTHRSGSSIRWDSTILRRRSDHSDPRPPARTRSRSPTRSGLPTSGVCNRGRCEDLHRAGLPRAVLWASSHGECRTARPSDFDQLRHSPSRNESTLSASR